MAVVVASRLGAGRKLAARHQLPWSAVCAAAASSSHGQATIARRTLATPTASPVPPAASGSRQGSHRIVVVGGGAAGQAASHQLLRTGLFADAADILVVDPASQHDYQPGWTLVGAGLKTREELRRPMQELIGDDKRLAYLQDAVETFEPEQNRLKTRDGRAISYEHLVVCPGIGTNWGAIKGLEERLREGRNVTSIYSYDSCQRVFPQLSKLTSGSAIFTQPAGVIKCAGAPQKIMWLGLDHWKGEGLFNPQDPASSKVQITFATGMPTMFGAPKYSAALEEMRKARGVEGLFNHNLTSIDGNVASFAAPPSGESKTSTTVQREFDFLHVTPPMGALPFIKNSPLADSATGFVDVDAGTTRHKRYNNVWSIGDSSSLPTSKTAAAITSQTPVMIANLSAVIQNRAPEEVYDGYTSCPLLTEYGKVMLAEFKYGGTPKETFGFLGIDQGVPRRAFYHLKRDFFPWVYYNSLVKGTWAGPKGWSLGLGQSARTMTTSARRSMASGQQIGRRTFMSGPVTLRNTPARRPRDPLDTAPNAERHAIPTGETFIVRPPPTAPSTFAPLRHTGPVSPDALPALRPRNRSTAMGESGRRLSEADIASMQALRASDPERNTATALAQRFSCSPTFVRIAAPLDKATRRRQQSEKERQRAEWGARKVMHREIRSERRALW